jgi:hypothetical protein
MRLNVILLALECAVNRVGPAAAPVYSAATQQPPVYPSSRTPSPGSMAEAGHGDTIMQLKASLSEKVQPT